MVQTTRYLIFATLLLAFAYLVFRRFVAGEYQHNGRLSWLASLLQLAVFTGFFLFPYLYMAPEWAWDWLPNGTWNRLAALVLVVLGMVLAFGTMLWFGLRRAFGVSVEGLVRHGPYRYSRNPQILGGWLMVLGVVVYRPSFAGVGWLTMWAIIAHWMVVTEEAHLSDVFGNGYRDYCYETPRYLLHR